MPRIPDYIIAPLLEVHRRLSSKRGETADRIIDPDPEWDLPPLWVGKVKFPAGCPSCLRAFSSLRRDGHQDDCVMA